STVLHSHGIKSTPFVCVLCLYFTAKLYTIILHMCLLSYYSVHIGRPLVGQFPENNENVIFDIRHLFYRAVRFEKRTSDARPYGLRNKTGRAPEKAVT
ncbi:MAG: hypothetical protein SOR56_08555, partial [Oscillospiraceae bacterium]|nr:hypothetical protein [Oscillospiraceae bacterium]